MVKALCSEKNCPDILNEKVLPDGQEMDNFHLIGTVSEGRKPWEASTHLRMPAQL